MDPKVSGIFNNFAYFYPATKDYWISKDSVRWREADSDCIKRNGTLLSIHSKWENAYIERILHATFVDAGEKDFWIGLSRANKDSGFVWSDNSQLDFKWWFHNIIFGKCVSISGRFPQFKWFAGDCASNQRYICTVSGMCPSVLFLMYQSIPSLIISRATPRDSLPGKSGFSSTFFVRGVGVLNLGTFLDLFQRNWRQLEKQAFLCCFISGFCKSGRCLLCF